MREVPEDGTSAFRFWIWLIACCSLLIGIAVGCDIGQAGRPLRIGLFAFAWLIVRLVTMVAYPRGLRAMLRDYWHNRIIGYDRVWYLTQEGNTSDRVEPRWKRDALLNCREGTPRRFAIYERVTGWGRRSRAFRIGQFDGTPHIVWRDDIKLTPRDQERDVLDFLIASDTNCPGIAFSRDGLLFFLNAVTVNSLSSGVQCLMAKVSALESSNAFKAQLILGRDAELAALKHEIAQAEEKHSSFVARALEDRLLLLAYKTNVENVVASALHALSDVEEVILSGTSLPTTKEGKELKLRVRNHYNGIDRLNARAVRGFSHGDTQVFPPPSLEDMHLFRYE